MFCYNTNIHEATNFTPYELVLGHEAREPSVKLTDKDETYGDYFKSTLIKLNDIQNKARENLITSKQRSKDYYDRKINPNELRIGDKVYMQRLDSKKKLEPYCEGPFEILDVDSTNKNAWIKYKKGKSKKVHLDYLRLSLE